MNALVAVANSPNAALPADAGLVRRFLAWAPKASADDRAEAVNALARAYLHSPLSSAARLDAAMALTAFLDDSSARVRRALAEAFASAADAPRHIVLALAGDQSDVARVVLARSPLLGDAELVDCVAVGDVVAQTAIARRPHLPSAVAAALAEVGEKAAVRAMVVNPSARIGVKTLRRVFERFGAEADMREALLMRPRLPSWLLGEIALATAAGLSEFAAACAWLDPKRAERITREAREQVFVTLALSRPEEEVAEFVAWLRQRQSLTVAVLMRALMRGDTRLLKHGLADMSGVPERRVAGFLRDFRGHGFASLYAKAGLPAHLLEAFRAALGVVAAHPGEGGAQVSYPMTSQLIRVCEAMNAPALSPLLSLLWRLAGESARDDAREFARDSLDPGPTPLLERLELPLAEQAPPVSVEIHGVNDSAPPVEIEMEAVEGEIADAA